MGISIIAVLKNNDPLDFQGRFILESSDDLMNTLVEEYQKRFNNLEKFAQYLMKFHWHSLVNTPFTNYYISVSVVGNRPLKKPVPIFLGETALFIPSGEIIEFVSPDHLDHNYISNLYIISLGDSLLTKYIYHDDLWTIQQIYHLGETVEVIPTDSLENNASPLSQQPQAEETLDMAD